jgi:hypothetical protein
MSGSRNGTVGTPAPRQYVVGDKIRVNMHAGKIVDATIKAVIDATDGAKYQVDFWSRSNRACR